MCKSRIADMIGLAKRARAKCKAEVVRLAAEMETISSELATLRGQEGKDDEIAKLVVSYDQRANDHHQATMELYDADEDLAELNERYAKS